MLGFILYDFWTAHEWTCHILIDFANTIILFLLTVQNFVFWGF